LGARGYVERERELVFVAARGGEERRDESKVSLKRLEMKRRGEEKRERVFF